MWIVCQTEGHCSKLMFYTMSTRKGIERYGKLAIAAMLKEYKQLDNLLVFGAVSPESMSDQERRRALCAINLIKLKRCGKVKGRPCRWERTERICCQRGFFIANNIPTSIIRYLDNQFYRRTQGTNIWSAWRISTRWDTRRRARIHEIWEGIRGHVWS